MKLAVVIGDPIAHSRSPAMLNAAFAASGIDAVMVPLQIAAADLPATIAGFRAMRILGASVTIPHKVNVAALCDELDAAARAIGAVNCLQLAGGRLVGHNTDAGGFVDGLREAGFDPAGKRVVVLGAGGAARAVVHGLAAATAPGEATVTVVARRPAETTWIRCRPWHELPAVLADADLLVDATSIGLNDDAPHGIPLAALPPHAWVATLIYHRETALLRDASSRGLATHDGRAMLVGQGARAFTLWTGRPAPRDVMLTALNAALA